MKRLAGLDVLRGLAVLLVLCRHIPIVLLPGLGIDSFLRVLQRGGWAGVDRFFVLSGYLVCGLLFDEYRKHGGVDPVRFLIRRGFRIYPAYYAMIAFSVAMSWKWVKAQNVLVETLFLQGYLQDLQMWN